MAAVTVSRNSMEFNAHNAVLVRVLLRSEEDPLTVRSQIALKMLLNAHSTAVMACLGRVIGNTMTNVNPSNLKLVGRATYLIMLHVNDTLRQPQWIAEHGTTSPVTFAEANAMLFDAMEYVRSRSAGQTAEVALSIVRAIEAFARRSSVEWDEARKIVESEGLDSYLTRRNPALMRR